MPNGIELLVERFDLAGAKRVYLLDFSDSEVDGVIRQHLDYGDVCLNILYTLKSHRDNKDSYPIPRYTRSLIMEKIESMEMIGPPGGSETSPTVTVKFDSDQCNFCCWKASPESCVISISETYLKRYLSKEGVMLALFEQMGFFDHGRITSVYNSYDIDVFDMLFMERNQRDYGTCSWKLSEE